MRPDPTRCLLLIDDEPAQRRLITAIGARAGWWVRGANDLDAAQKMFADPQEPKFDAILLDHWLPGEEGTDLHPPAAPAEARASPPRPHRPDQRRRRRRRDARRGQRFPRQAAGARPAARRARRRHRPPPQVGRAAPAVGEDRPDARLRGDCRLGVPVPRRHGDRRQGRPRPCLGADRGRKRLGQGDHRPGNPRREPTRQEAAPHRQLRRHPGQPRRIGPVRPREGQLHRRLRPPYRPLRGCRRLDPVPRRGRRAAAGDPGQAAARARDRRVPAGRQPHHPDRRRPHHRRDQPPPDRRGRRRPLPRGPLLPAQRRPRADPAPARPASATSRPSPATCCRGSPSSRACAISRSPTTAWRS